MPSVFELLFDTYGDHLMQEQAPYNEAEIQAALEQAKKATEMEPQNAEYAGWRQRMESGGSWYTGRQTQYGGMPVSSGSGFCWKLCLANLICNLCCGGGGLCCGGMPAGYH